MQVHRQVLQLLNNLHPNQYKKAPLFHLLKLLESWKKISNLLLGNWSNFIENLRVVNQLDIGRKMTTGSTFHAFESLTS